MHEELDPGAGATTELEPELPPEEQDHPGCEMIDGVWVPKHPDGPPPDDDRPGCELIDGVWVEKEREADAKKGVVYYLRDGRVRGVLLWNVWKQVDAARRLIAEPGPFRPADLIGRLPSAQ